MEKTAITEDPRYEILIDYAKSHFADLIPYDDLDYEEKLQKMAEDYADLEINGNKDFEELCKLHDETLEDGTLPVIKGPFDDFDINELFSND